MKNVLSGVVAALALSWAIPGAAQVTGNTLLRDAAAYKRVEAGGQNSADAVGGGWLQGFTFGVAVTLDRTDDKTCLPNNSNSGQYVRVLIQYLEANPAELHKSGMDLAIAAFRKAFPCR